VCKNSTHESNLSRASELMNTVYRQINVVYRNIGRNLLVLPVPDSVALGVLVVMRLTTWEGEADMGIGRINECGAVEMIERAAKP
jgi:hypothetical protein